MKVNLKKQKTKTIVHETFRSLDHMLTSLDERPLNAVFSRRSDLSSQTKEKTENGWYGTKDYKQATDVLRVGYKEPLEQMKKAILKIGEMDNYKRPRAQVDFVGFVPHVPNTLMNLPMTMINKQKTPQKAKTVHLTYSFCALSQVSSRQIIKGGVNFISLVNSLEKQGYRVKIDITFIAVTDKTAAGFSINLKEYGQQLNLLKLAFPLVHPSMLRRFSFKWLETSPELKDTSFTYGYGRTLGADMNNDGRREQEFMKQNGMLKRDDNSYYCNVYEAFQANDIEELARTIGITK